MPELKRYKKVLVAAAAIGIMGFAGYGTQHMAAAFTADQKKAVAITTTAPENAKILLTANGNTCSPLGCAACRGCVNPFYQNSSEIISNITPVSQ